MLAGMTHFITHAIAVQATLILAGYTGAGGTPLPVAVRRAYAPEPAALPMVDIETTPPTDLLKNLIGQGGGYDASGNRLYQTYAEGFRCQLGFRAATPAERDDLFDTVTTQLLFGINPASGRQWCEELYTVSGLKLDDLAGSMFAPEQTSAHGQVFAATTTLLVSTMVSVTVATVPIVSLTVVPNASLVLPLS